ncbi:beta-1,6-N-acetylglucosaminyltransferase [Megamonas funiformis]|uniref:beta-1,6-N-acetylglucosaminyltransferase n=1 Tax=Megamonas funiformis TaxID=437897 RepID=UPI003522B0D4
MKHAYLIMAHNQFYVLEILLKLIDDERNDIFLHIDKKVSNFDFDYFKTIIKKSNLYFTRRYDIKWGDISLTKATINILEEAVGNRKTYRYYHLLSGVDLPLRTQDQIHAFFEDKNNEFIHFCGKENRKNVIDRYIYLHFFTKYLREKNKIYKIFRLIDKTVLLFQKMIDIKSNKFNNLEIRVGSNWFSITGNFAEYIIRNKNNIFKIYKNTKISDESFLQTLVYNSKFKKNLYKNAIENDDYMACLRYIDWSRGNPYIWRIEDYDQLINSNYLFARKFDEKESKELIEKIYIKLSTE